MASRGERWAFWLEAELDRRGWARSEIAKRSRKKSNGRPVIDASRVSEWLNKNEAPRDPDMMLELAHILGVRTAVVLNAAGWLPDHELEGGPVVADQVVDVAEAIRRDDELVERARVHLLDQYQMLRELSGHAGTTERQQALPQPAQRPLRAVARRRPPKT